MSIKVEVTNKMNEKVGEFTENQFSAWKRALGGDVDFLWKRGEDGEGAIIDTTRLLRSTLRPGTHQGLLVVKARLPQDFNQANVEAWQLA